MGYWTMHIGWGVLALLTGCAAETGGGGFGGPQPVVEVSEGGAETSTTDAPAPSSDAPIPAWDAGQDSGPTPTPDAAPDVVQAPDTAPIPDAGAPAPDAGPDVFPGGPGTSRCVGTITATGAPAMIYCQSSNGVQTDSGSANFHATAPDGGTSYLCTDLSPQCPRGWSCYGFDGNAGLVQGTCP